MLASLIAQMQENADQVEKDILSSEEMLAVVRTLTPKCLSVTLPLSISPSVSSAPPPGQ